MDLPKRSLPLDFALPEISARFKVSKSGGGEFTCALNESKAVPAEYLRLLLAEIKHMNRCGMKPSQRENLNDEVLEFFYPVALAQIAKYAETGGIPESDDCRQTLLMLVDIAQILIVSCQILFDGYYRASNYKYSKARVTVLQCASRIFELMILKQHVRALRYQLLGEQDWRLVNTLFYVLGQYEDVAQLLPTVQQEIGLKVGRSAVSFREQFVLLHIVAKFDMLSWPANLQWVIESYLRGIGNAVQVSMDVESAKPARNELICYCYGSQAARVQPLASPPGPAMMLNCNVLMDAIRKDCLGLAQSRKNPAGVGLPPRFARFHESERYVISERLLDGLQASQPVLLEQRTSVCDFRIFVGFTEVFNLLRHQQGGYASEERLADALAKRSALIAEDSQTADQSLWSILYQNKYMVRMSTQESPFTIPMHIGELLAYGIGEDIQRPRLAVITRIFRSSEVGLVIDMQHIASYAEPVLMSVNASEQSKSEKIGVSPALLVHDKSNPLRWNMMFPPKDVLPGVDRIVIYRAQQEIAVELVSLCDATMYFHLFTTKLGSPQLNKEDEK